MRVITAIEEYKKSEDDICVFLAGGITNCWEWQDAVIEELKKRCKEGYNDLVIINPRRKNFPINDPNASKEQIEWEFEMLEKADIFSMYFTEGVSDQPICMYELGRNIVRMQMRFPLDLDDRIAITCENGYKRKNDVLIQTRLAAGFEPLMITVCSKREETHMAHASKIRVLYHCLKRTLSVYPDWD